MPTDDIYWGDFIAMESQLRLLGDVNGKRILEIGCGGAQNSIVLLKWGAEAYGIDLSRKQIIYGKRLANKEGAKISLIVGNMEELPFKDKSFDIVTTSISLLYVPDLHAAIAEANRVLVKNGHFVFSESHPLAEAKLTRFKGKPAAAVRDYFKRRILRWSDRLPNGSMVRMHSYYRTLQDYFDALLENGFVIERYLEPERMENDELKDLDRKDFEKYRYAQQLYKLMKEVPIWFLVKARKSSSSVSRAG